MPYLFHQNKHFTLVDHSQKSGVYCQIYSNHSNKPIFVSPPGTKDYYSFMDEKEQLYIVTMPDSFHINLHLFDGTHFSKQSLISNSTSHYILSRPMLYHLNGKNYVAYISHQHDTPTYNFVQESMDSPNLTILYTLSTQPTQIKCYSPTSYITYIFFTTHDESDHLYALEITAQQTTLIKYLSSPVPIIDYSICYHKEVMHITYVSELHGKYQLCYFNNTLQKVVAIMTTLMPCKPVVFCYYHTLWINMLLGRDLQILLSVDEGRSFSTSVNASLQSNIRRCQFSTNSPHDLAAHELYASVSTTLKLCTIAMVDIYHLHADSIISPETELLLEGLSLRTLPLTSFSTESIPFLDIQQAPADPTPPKQSLDNAKKAFMKELNGWDLPPRI